MKQLVFGLALALVLSVVLCGCGGGGGGGGAGNQKVNPPPETPKEPAPDSQIDPPTARE
jgi:hypothetical protein